MARGRTLRAGRPVPAFWEVTAAYRRQPAIIAVPLRGHALISARARARPPIDTVHCTIVHTCHSLLLLCSPASASTSC